MKEIENINYKGQHHGYQEWYSGGKLFYKGFYKNGVDVDYEEFYNINFKLIKSFYI